MKKLKIKLENCYGISKMEHEIEFSKKNIAIIYASNGTMKTSLANTFNCIKNGKEPEDRITKIKGKCEIIDGNGEIIDGKSIIVINPFVETITDNQNLLMANPELREKYDEICIEIRTKKKELYSKLKSKLNLSKKNIEKDYLLPLWGYDKNELFTCLKNIFESFNKDDMECQLKDEDLKYYNTLFDDKVYNLLKDDAELTTLIEDYATKYNELIEKSLYLTNIFGYNNCIDIKDTLVKNKFFEADNKVLLKAKNSNNEDIIISTEKEFSKFIEEEKNLVLDTEELKNKFETINKKLKKNIQVKEFAEFIKKNQGIVHEYTDIDNFKRKVWRKSFLLYRLELKDLLEKYDNASNNIKALVAKAKEEETDWMKAINEFKDKFYYVPFTIEPSNQEDVILKNDEIIPSFKYLCYGEEHNIQKDELLNVLSTGEKRAYYLLNLIFEILVAKKNDEEKLIILDDITDSFDCNNKYAIIEYIYEISKYQNKNGEKLFKLLLLTHNFDFYNAIDRVLNLGNENKLVAYKNEKNSIVLENVTSLTNIFERNAQQINASNGKKLKTNKKSELNKTIISSIPMVRTLIEFQVSIENRQKDEGYTKLTSVLHYRNNTKSITLKEIKDIFKIYWIKEIKSNKGDEKMLVYDELIAQAEKIMTPQKTGKKKKEEVFAIQSKLILSMALRLKTEEFMINQIKKLNIEIEEDEIKTTKRLLERYKENFSNDKYLQIFERVCMLTNEYIHLNSFVYEPLIDMSLMNLSKLYKEVKELNV